MRTEPTPGAAGVVARYRELLDGQDPHDFAEVPVLAAYLRELVALAEQAISLNDDFGILDHGGGWRSAQAEPIGMPAWNAALSVELRAKGIFDPGGRRPATLMQRKVTGWSEIPMDATPDDVFPGYSERQAAAKKEADV